jgi:hypothetical protein
LHWRLGGLQNQFGHRLEEKSVMLLKNEEIGEKGENCAKGFCDFHPL